MNTNKPCPFCKKDISSDAIKCPHCQSELRSWFRRHPIVTGFLLIFIVFPITMGIFSNTTDTTPQEKLIIPGQNAFIKEFTHGAMTKDIYNRANQLEQVNDSVGVQQLYSADLIFELAKGTTVKVIDSDNASSFGQMIYQVRAMEGKNKGRAGWVAKTDLVDSLK